MHLEIIVISGDLQNMKENCGGDEGGGGRGGGE
jgi:hypothetical protein